MSSVPPSPKPFQAIVAAVVAHIAFLQAPDVVEPLWILLLYGVAILTLFMVRTWLRGGQAVENAPLRFRCVVAGAVADVLLFVGAGYCTSIEPGVIKLGGVLPLGWTIAALVLIDELIRTSQSQPQGTSAAADRAQSERWLILAIGTLIAMVEQLLGEEPRGLKGILTALFFYSAYTCWRRYRRALRTEVVPKD